MKYLPSLAKRVTVKGSWANHQFVIIHDFYQSAFYIFGGKWKG